jgi:hypothetical protein
MVLREVTEEEQILPPPRDSANTGHAPATALEPPEEGEPLLHAATKGGGAEGTADGTSSHDVPGEGFD